MNETHRNTVLLASFVVCLAAWVNIARADGPAKVSVEWDGQQIANCRRSSSVGPAAGLGLTLVGRDLIRYETGATVHAADRDGVAELVSETTWIRKHFDLESVACRSAVLTFCHSGEAGKLEVLFNDQPVAFEVVHTRASALDGVYPPDRFPEGHAMHHLNGKPFKSWWRGGWQEVQIDPKLLRVGRNTVVIRGREGTSCRFHIEQSIYPNMSAVSRDGGKTWDYDNLSSNRNLNGEYVIRLQLGRHPADGWIESEPADLWPRIDGTDVATPAVVEKIELVGQGQSLAGQAARARFLVRVGPSAEYDPKTWTAWDEANELAAGRANGKPLADGEYRYAQWRCELTSSADRQSAPTLAGVQVVAAVRPRPLPGGLKITAGKVEQAQIIRPSHVFVHAKKTNRLEMLREQAGLDELVKDAPTSFEQLRRIAAWIPKLKVANNGGGKLDYMPSWDGLLFWNFARPGEIGRMCTTRGAFFVQCATALGYAARPCIWSHAIAEAWIDDLGKWVAFDPSGGFYFTVNDEPASMLEVALAWKNPKLEVRRQWNSKSKSKPLPDDTVAWHTRYFVPMRSNLLESDEPQEPAHGNYAFKYDGHLRWLHPDREPLPWFNFTTSRDGDLNFTCNTVNLSLSRPSESETLTVEFVTDMPNLERFEARSGDGEWIAVQSPYKWAVSPGENRLQVRGVNVFGLAGRPARATVTVVE